jgi:hypothetical protein
MYWVFITASWSLFTSFLPPLNAPMSKNLIILQFDIYDLQRTFKDSILSAEYNSTVK